MSAPDAFASPPSAEAMIDAANREGYYEATYRQVGKELTATYRRLRDAREALAAAVERIEELEGQVSDWRALAFQYGTATTAEKRREVGQLHGNVVIARDMLRDAPEAINYACADLAKKLHAEAKKVAS